MTYITKHCDCDGWLHDIDTWDDWVFCPHCGKKLEEKENKDV